MLREGWFPETAVLKLVRFQHGKIRFDSWRVAQGVFRRALIRWVTSGGDLVIEFHAPVISSTPTRLSMSAFGKGKSMSVWDIVLGLVVVVGYGFLCWFVETTAQEQEHERK